ncbi:saccharopine dehydrogenase [Diaporthe amygdali]|uniref:saccharopine dehydrogenase n=1 Tax=Phomopsis amygdali TaxID=1214568 RepID=UPI0022FEFA80|nr:saccharopine dehydrogenase [Diaporthe amygdali]KAJ0107590.1 saccharopine dehydrogenase [Diaporthe amygdali]
MGFKQHGRTYDLVVFGATGYTGKYTAEHITTHLPTDLKWAIAGRSREKLQKLADELKPLNPDRRQPELEICSLNGDDLGALAKKTFILITTVGPYGQYGEHAFKACAENGTHYFDVTGEVPFVARMIKKYEKVAKQTGSMLFPEIGFESAPADLIVWSLAKHNRTELAAKTREAVMSIHRINAAPSGGTLASLLGFFDTFSLKEITETMRPFALSPVPNPNAASHKPSLKTRLTGLRTVPNLGKMTTCLAGDSDRAIIGRTWGLFEQIGTKEAEAYGPNFAFSEYMRTRNWLSGVLMHWGIAVVSVLLVALPPLRSVVRRFVYKQGDGPDKEQSKKHEIEIRGVAAPDTERPVGKQAFCRATYFGSMYALTGTLLAEAALTVLEDDIDLGGGGVFTPACLGQGFVDRLDGAGFKIQTESVLT